METPISCSVRLGPFPSGRIRVGVGGSACRRADQRFVNGESCQRIPVSGSVEVDLCLSWAVAANPRSPTTQRSVAIPPLIARCHAPRTRSARQQDLSLWAPSQFPGCRRGWAATLPKSPSPRPTPQRPRSREPRTFLSGTLCLICSLATPASAGSNPFLTFRCARSTPTRVRCALAGRSAGTARYCLPWICTHQLHIRRSRTRSKPMVTAHNAAWSSRAAYLCIYAVYRARRPRWRRGI